MSERALFSSALAAEYAEGELLGDPSGEIFEVSIDSRTCRPGSLFVPLPGEKTDGHLYIEQAFTRGAEAAFVEKGFFGKQAAVIPGKNVILVKDTLRALQKLAEAYLAGRQNIITVGVTGSNGKTTTKELIGSILRTLGPLVVSEGNYNSDIGVALSVFKVTDVHRYAVFEMGMNRAGEMREIAGIVKPRAALITNVGSAHIGILGSIEAIAKEKKEIFSYFSGSETGYVYEEEPFLSFLTADVKGAVVPYGPAHTPGFEGSSDLGLKGSILTFDEGSIKLSLPGQYNVMNALGAIALGRGLGATFDQLKKGIESVVPLSGRGEVIEGSVTVIKDCYNANPESLKQALSFVSSLGWEGEKVAVVGSLKELGEFTMELHLEAASDLLNAHLDLVFLYGNETYDTWREYETTRPGTSFWTRDMEELKNFLRQKIKTGTLVLIKGSRSNVLEQVMDSLVTKEQG